VPALATAAKAFTTPWIKSLLEKRPDIQRRVARANMVSAIRIQNGAKSRSPVLFGRMKQSINIVKLDDVGLELNIGTNVVAAPPGTEQPIFGGRKRPFKARVPKGGYKTGPWKYSIKSGYSYPMRMEYDTRLHHTDGEWGFLRKSLRDEAPKHAEQCRRALVNGMKGYA